MATGLGAMISHILSPGTTATVASPATGSYVSYANSPVLTSGVAQATPGMWQNVNISGVPTIDLNEMLLDLSRSLRVNAEPPASEDMYVNVSAQLIWQMIKVMESIAQRTGLVVPEEMESGDVIDALLERQDG